MLNKDDEKGFADLDKADQDWLRGFADEKVAEADPKTMREVSALREAMRAEERLEKIRGRLFWHRMARRVKYAFIKRFSVDYIGQWKVAVPIVFVGVIFVGVIFSSLLQQQNGTISGDDSGGPQQKGTELRADRKWADNFWPSANPQERANKLKERFISAGAEVEIVQHSVFELNVKMPNNPSEKLRNLCQDKKKDGRSCSEVEIIFVGPTELIRR